MILNSNYEKKINFYEYARGGAGRVRGRELESYVEFGFRDTRP